MVLNKMTHRSISFEKSPGALIDRREPKYMIPRGDYHVK